jgi:hypothetical protein
MTGPNSHVDLPITPKYGLESPEMRSVRRSLSKQATPAAGLVVYCLILAAITGDYGFEGDDWWVFSWPYWIAFPKSLVEFAASCLRPIEGVYWIGLFEIFGFNRIAFHVFSLLLLTGSCLLMGACLLRAFPERCAFAFSAVLFAFFLPTVAPLTYVLATDNSRLSLLFFWACAFAFQRWAIRGYSWTGLAAPALLYVSAFLTYEAPSFLLFVVPLLVWPIRLRNQNGVSDKVFCLRLATSILAAFFSALAIRFLFLSGGVVQHRHLLPTWESLWSYPALLPFYLVSPFTNVVADSAALAVAIAASIWAAALLLPALRDSVAGRPDSLRFVEGPYYPFVLGGAILALGMLPYQLAGYGSVAPKLVDTVMVKWGAYPVGNTAWFNFNWSSRIYCAGSFGIAVVIASLITMWKTAGTRTIAGVVAVICLGFMVLFHAGLSKDWREAGAIRNGLIADLVNKVPDVKPGTNFVVLDLDHSHGRASVFRGWNGLRDLIRMVYSRTDIGAWYLYPYSWKWPDYLFHEAVVSKDGFVSRGIKLNSPVPQESLLLMKRRLNHLELLDAVNAGDGSVPTGILWKGASSLNSNQDRILRPSVFLRTDDQAAMRRARDTGLYSTLGLSDRLPRAVE